MRRLLLSFLLVFLFITDAIPKIKGQLRDISSIVGIRDNQLIGYGIVAGLKGTGDSKKSKLLLETAANMLQKLDINVNIESINSRNIASVIVTAIIPPFKKEGDTIDVTVSSIGDAKNISGGILLQTQLRGADGIIYAIAQGSVVTYAEKQRGKAQAVNVGYIPGSAVVEREIPMEYINNNAITLSLISDDWKTISQVVNEINTKFPEANAKAENMNNIDLTIPAEFSEKVHEFISSLQEIEIEYEEISKVVFDNRTKTIVMGGDVKVSSVAIAHGDLKLVIEKSLEEMDFEEEKEENTIFMIEESADVRNIVDGLNSVGASVDDIIAILTALKNAGALKSKLIIL